MLSHEQYCQLRRALEHLNTLSLMAADSYAACVINRIQTNIDNVLKEDAEANKNIMSKKDKLIARYYNRTAYYEITEKDIDKTTFWFHGPQSFKNIIGRVLPQDIGKRIYMIDNVLQCENTEQFTKRVYCEHKSW